jgi:dTMP kinase
MFISIEGLDGAGKSTQIQLLRQCLQTPGRATRYIHFPRVDTGIWGDMVARFLRGDFGVIGEVNPDLVALLYAEDRRAAAPQLQQWLADGNVVIADRYVYSNIAFQCAKANNDAEYGTLRKWILTLEYTEFNLPKPDVCLFLDVPFGFTQRTLQQERTGADRAYLQGKADIHESNLDFQRRVREVYLRQTDEDTTFHVIPCTDETTGEMLTKEAVFEKIKQIIVEKN